MTLQFSARHKILTMRENLKRNSTARPGLTDSMEKALEKRIFTMINSCYDIILWFCGCGDGQRESNSSVAASNSARKEFPTSSSVLRT